MSIPVDTTYRPTDQEIERLVRPFTLSEASEGVRAIVRTAVENDRKQRAEGPLNLTLPANSFKRELWVIGDVRDLEGSRTIALERIDDDEVPVERISYWEGADNLYRNVRIARKIDAVCWEDA